MDGYVVISNLKASNKKTIMFHTSGLTAYSENFQEATVFHQPHTNFPLINNLKDLSGYENANISISDLFRQTKLKMN